ncbi:MAG: alpha/beta hydrolase [Planctomycetes bacterium]|nr:alpha/beta hydrolase [Planctomycetota bacterium]
MRSVMVPASQSGRVVRGLLLAGAAGLLLSGAVISGCGSMAVEDVKAQTLALPKNAPLLEGLRTGILDGTGDPWMASSLPAAGGAGGAGRPVVLVHGTPDGMGAWTRVLFGEGGLAGKEDIHTVEVIGHGMLGVEGGEVTFQRCADHVAATLRALGLEGVTLVGNSYGGEFCWRAALDHPDLISRLVLIDSSGLPRTDEQFLSEEVKMREWSVARLGYLVNSEPRVASALDPHFDGGADPERVKEVFLGLENRGNWNAMIDLVRDENGARAGELAGLQPPTLLLWGELDQAYPPATFGATFAERIPAARLVVVPGAGHYPHEQTPARVAQAILAFHRGGLTAPGLTLPGR